MQTLSITGTIIFRNSKKGIPGLRVEAWDKDLVFNDLVGSAVTDASGRFTISFTQSYFAELFFDRQPDLFFRIFYNDKLVHSTEKNILWNAKAPAEGIIIPLDLDIPAVRDFFNNTEAPATQTVSGTLLDADNKPIPGLRIVVYDKDLRREELLAEGSTDSRGQYNITYSVYGGTNAEAGTADLLVKAYQGDTVIARSEVLFNAPDKAVLNLRAGQQYKARPAYEQVSAILLPLLDGIAPHELEESEAFPDISFLTGETGLPRTTIENWALAQQLGVKSNMEPEFWYALLAGKLINAPGWQNTGGTTGTGNLLAQQLAMVLSGLPAISSTSVNTALQDAFNNNIINRQWETKVPVWIDAFFRFAQQQTGPGGNPQQLQQLLDITNLNKDQKESFMRLYNDYGDFIKTMQDDLLNKHSFTSENVGSIASAMKLSEITFGNKALAEAAIKEYGIGTEKDVKALAGISTADWKQLIIKHGIPLREEVQGESEEDRLHQYAVLINKRFEQAYPTTAFAGGLQRSMEAKTTALTHAAELVEFLDINPDIELATLHIDNHLQASAQEENAAAPNAGFITELKAVQRVFKLAPVYKAVNTLMDANIHSAHQVAQYGEKQFINTFKDKAGFTSKTASDAWRSAVQTQAAVATIMGEAAAMQDAYHVHALAANKAAMTDYANWGELFGKADICDCEHCRSVYSPAAYMADILQFLKNRDTQVTPGEKAKTVLMRRRPDIAFLDLNCANANTTLPYVDIANEIMEEDLAPARLFSAATPADWNNNNTIRATLAGIFSGNNITLGADFTVSPVTTVTDRQTYTCRVVRDSAVTYRLKVNGGNIEASILRQTHGTAAERSAAPEYVNAAAYNILKAAKYPLTLPFDLFNEEARAYLSKVNVQRWELMETFRNAANNTAEDAAAEYFGISIGITAPATTDERTIITQAQEGLQHEYWGNYGNNVAMLNEVKMVDIFLQKTGLEYNQLLQLLDLPFINPNGNLKIMHEDNTCNTGAKHIDALDARALDRLHRFIRLWRKLGWETWEVDLAIRSSGIGKGNINGPMLVQLMYADRLLKKFGDITVEQLCVLFGDMNTRSKFTALYQDRKLSLYEERFLNKKLINPVDTAFAIEALPSAELVANHIAVVMGGTKSKEQDINILLNMKKTDGTAFTGNTLTLPNLTFLYRHSLLGRLLGFKMAEWEKLLSIIREDIVTLPDAGAAWQLATFADNLREAGFTLDELRYWIQHDLTAKAAPKASAITGFISGLRAQLNAINATYTVTDIPEENMAAITTQLLRAGWDADTTGTVQSIFDNTYIASVRLPAALPAVFTDFPETVTKDSVTGQTIIDIKYDPQSRQMTLTGMMTDVHKNSLKTHIDLGAVTALPDYKNAIDALYADSRSFITRELRFYKQPLFGQSLALASATADFNQLPTWLGRHIAYDKEKQLLQYKGVMTVAGQALLKTLPGNNATYNAAVDSLFTSSTTAVFTAADEWIGNAELANYFNAPASYDSATITANIKAAAAKLFAYLRPADIEAVVLQQAAQQFSLNSDAARFLLSSYAVNPPSADTILQYFINATPPYTNDERVYYWLHKVSGIIQKTGMDLEALQWLKEYAAKTNTIDWLALPVAAAPPVALLGKLLRLYQYVSFNRRYAVEDISLWRITRQLDTPPTYANNTAFAKAVNAWNGWSEKDIVSFTNTNFLDIAYPNAYLQIESWKRLSLAFDMLSSINQSAATAAALATAGVTAGVSQQLKQSIRSRFEDEQWFGLSQGIQDALRERKRDSLAAALLVHKPAYVPAAVKWENANDLFSFYLVDVEMCSCQLTSRLVQANGSIQLFVQRCMMALETGVRVDTDEDDGWLQWKWMKNYRVWEANRKVFLYPENWIEPELRKDKSNFFKEFENELLQNEITKETVEDALLSYLNKLDSVAQLEIAGFYYEENKDTLHVFGRTPAGDPHIYYYRQWVNNRRWTPWAKVDVEISSDYLVPYIINNRMYIFWPIFTEMADQPEEILIPAPGGSAEKDKKTKPPEKFQKVQMAMSELRHGKWTGKKISKDYLKTSTYRGDVVKDQYNFYPADLTSLEGGFYIICSGNASRPDGTSPMAYLYGSFEIFGCKGVPEKSNYYNSVNEVIQVVDAENRYLKPTEIPYRDNRQDFSLDNLFAYLGEGNNNNNRRETILNLTPGIFRVTTSPNIMEMDTWFASIYELVRVLTGGKGHDKRPIPSGVWSSFFYADKTRTFFVQPMVGGANGVPYYYNDIKAFIQKIRDVWNQLTEDWIKSIPFTDEQKEYIRYIFRLIFNSFAAVIVNNLYPRRQYHFRNFYHPFVCSFMKETANRGVDGLMRREIQLKNTGFDFKKVYDPTLKVLDTLPPSVTKYYPEEMVDFSGSGSYSQYNWELFFHAPLMIAGMLGKNQRFEEAMQWFHYIFNPLSPLTKDVNGNPIPITSPQQKYWITKPFFERQQAGYDKEHIDNILMMLAGDTSIPGYDAVYKDELVEQVADWRRNPFEPHKIAQFRTVAYQKTVVMKYIDNLVAWGDQLFRQDTMESVNQATLLYVLAAEILGTRPQKIPPRIKPITETYNELEKDLDAFSNALVRVENLMPLMPPQEGVEPGIPPIHVLYFCIPQNDKLLGYWDTVADRLYKIRHCLNIEGVFRQLSLFAPPIDPAALVRAVGGGADLASAINDLNAPLPHYRFNITLQKANELCNDVKALGNALSAALEKKDGEAMSLLRQTHELRALNAATDIKKKQLEDANESLAGLYKNKEMTTLKRDYYNSRPFISTGEKRAMDLQADARILQTIAGVLETLGSVLAIIPDFNLGASGFGGTPQVTAMTGGQAFSKAVEFSARGLNQVAGIMDKEAGVASTMAGYVRRKEDWDFQRDLANKELEQIEKQIAGAKIKISIAEKEIKNHELQIENSVAVDEFMRTKYTNKELYEWMTAQLSQTYFRTYQLAYDIAKRAERCYQFELGVTNSSFIKFGYWDSLRKGLLSGEQMQQDLRRLDNAYMEQNRREMELTKHISLSLTDPLALVQLKEKGRCVLNLPEEVFDLDYPGHYFRRLRSVSLSIPCIAGPHTTINCTLRLLKNSLRINNKLNAGKYERNNDGGLPLDDDRFRESNVLVKSIATSNAQNDNGLFEMNFRDERYLPFEGAGAISTWSIELLYHPDEETGMLRQFNYDHISDVILHLRYSAREDAGLFRKGAIKYLKTLIKTAADNNTMPLMNMMSIKHEFPQQYHTLISTPVTEANAVTKLDIRKDRFPYLAQGMKLKIRKMTLLAKFKDGGTATVTLTDPDGTALNPMNLVDLPKFGKSIKAGIADADFEIKPNGTAGAKWEWTVAMPRNRAIQLEDLVMIVLYDLNGI